MLWVRVAHLGLAFVLCWLSLYCRGAQRSQAMASWAARYMAGETARCPCAVTLSCHLSGRQARCDVELTQAGATTTYAALPVRISAREVRLIAPGAAYTDSTATHATVHRALIARSADGLYRFEIAWMTLAAEGEEGLILRRRFCSGLVPVAL
ncbi:MAG: hypothetical protein H7A21_12965 [Spirochaetales bacterium]|nr:hypothetical protein [Leptospiraceae bacterium]MCP5482339.1 hypothetical protein [Spirochaetales bacterium]MCP5484222.1 hypothetical protein [Spirochaetales bacterium]